MPGVQLQSGIKENRFPSLDLHLVTTYKFDHVQQDSKACVRKHNKQGMQRAADLLTLVINKRYYKDDDVVVKIEVGKRDHELTQAHHCHLCQSFVCL